VLEIELMLEYEHLKKVEKLDLRRITELCFILEKNFETEYQNVKNIMKCHIMR
jgi:hypothetical protein